MLMRHRQEGLGPRFFGRRHASEKRGTPRPLFQIEVYFSGKEIGSYLDLTDKISKLYAKIRNTYVVLRTLPSLR